METQQVLPADLIMAEMLSINFRNITLLAIISSRIGFRRGVAYHVVVLVS